jgi:hypothetical protein
MAHTKEVHFFNNEFLFARDQVNYDFYHTYFDPPTHGVLRGEVTPAYMYCGACPQRIKKYHPPIKLIALLRDPADRAFSHWNMQRERGLEGLPFGDAIQIEQRRLSRLPVLQASKFAYVSRGFYGKQLERTLQLFPREQLLALKSDVLWHNPLATMNQVFEFLGLDGLPQLAHHQVHSGHYRTAMTTQERALLIDLYRNDIMLLEQLLGWDCSEWRQL